MKGWAEEGGGRGGDKGEEGRGGDKVEEGRGGGKGGIR